MKKRIRNRASVDRRNAKVRAIRAANRATRIVIEKARRDARRSEVNAIKRAWYAANPDKAKAERRRYYLKYKHKSVARKALRKATLLRATPAWANPFFIEEIYDLSRRRTVATGFAWNVDHIVPLQNELVCGLHVENNLRVIPRAQNRLKHNRHDPLCDSPLLQF